MNENLDLTKILEGCPKGAKFYSPMMGNVKFDSIVGKFIYVVTIYGNVEPIERTGNYKRYNGECMLLPSKDQRDWSKFVRFWDKPKIENPKVEKFDPKTLQPFDKVLVRENVYDFWRAVLFSHIYTPSHRAECNSMLWKECVPYNEETKHLVGTKEDCPEYYKWWEE